MSPYHNHLPLSIFMELPSMIMVLLFAFALTRVEISMCHFVKGSVSCLDCSHHHLAGVRVAVKCSQEKRLAFALTDKEGSFQTKLPLSSSSPSPNCSAMLLGGPQKLCSSKKTLVSNIVKAHDSHSYTISTPLTFFSTCSSSITSKSGSAEPGIKSSKTIDLPLPPEWGVRVAVKCSQEKRLAFALTDKEGSFQTKLPLSSSSPSPNCSAMLLGGPQKLCSSKKTLVSNIVKAHDSHSYTISTPLTFFSTCSSSITSKSGSAEPGIKSSKTIDLPLPPEWGLAPSSYYIPFIPIIGIP
ncbi:uncharacterized protein LOC143877507 [Tasmannia lanceolata]|uniref:uncharacterized protein LOC143877507 n=1 Tax=Tasmannia lanceolata TaxID=3420 RepID=UPI004063196E